MMTPITLEQSIEISSLCREISNLTEHVCSVSVVNKNGRIIDSILRDDKIFTNFSRHDFEILYMQRKLQTSMNKELDEKFGVTTYSIIDRESLLEFVFPFYDGIVLVVTRPKIHLTNFAKKVSRAIIKFEFDGVKRLR